MSNWTRLTSVSSRAEAELVKSLLDQSGISVLIKAEDLGSQMSGISSVELWVREDDLEESATLLGISRTEET